MYLKSRVGSVKLSRKNRDLLYQILEDAQWVAFRSELLIDHPEHRATVDLVVREYLPVIMSDHYEVAARNLTRKQERKLNDFTRADLVNLGTDVRQVREAISKGSLDKLESHADALARSLETRITLPPDVVRSTEAF